MTRNETFLKRLFRWRLLFVVNFLLILFLSLTLGRDFLKTREIQKEIYSLQSQANELAVKNFSVTELQTAIQTQSFIEREARLKLGMKKPEEKVIVFTNDQVLIKDVSDGNGTDSDPLGFVLGSQEQESIANSTKWWYYFFNRNAFEEIKTYEN